MYLFGAHDEELARLKNEGEDALRVGGQLLASTFELDANDVFGIVERIHDADIMWNSRIPGVTELICARLAEGVYEEGEELLAREVADRIGIDEYRQQALTYFEHKDGGLIRERHI